jgi:hypothetical protein
MLTRVDDAGLGDIAEKLDAEVRLFEDGVRLFECPDTLALGWLANRSARSVTARGPTTTSTSGSRRRTSA